eukprot:gene9491-10482_t
MRFRSSLYLLGSLPRKGLGQSCTNIAMMSGCAGTCSGAGACSGSIPSLVSSSEALNLFNCHAVKFLDGSWQLGKGALTDNFSKERIPGAQFFNIDQVSDTTSPLPHMLPKPEVFEEAIASLGISSDDHVVVYTQADTFSAARVWWTFKVFGHDKVSILNGGLPAWKNEQGPVDQGPITTTTPRGNFSVHYRPEMVADWRRVLEVVENGSAQILDARSKARFLGQAPEPRPSLPSGHIPGSLSLPFTEIVEEKDATRFRELAQIRDAFVEAGFIMGSNAIFSCGSGVTAAVLLFGLHLIGKDLKTTQLYDGSWSEWASRSDLPRYNPTEEGATSQ